MNPILDKRFPDRINDINRRLKNLELSSQPEFSDWRSLQPNFFTYLSSSSLTIDTSAYNGEDIFTIGMPVRMKQTGDSDYRYFYVMGRTSGILYLSAGDDYTIANATVIALDIGMRSDPSDHPLVFDFSTALKVYTTNLTPTTTDNSALFSGGSGSKSCKFSMQGSIVTVWYDFGTSALPVNIQAVVVTSPFIERSQSAGSGGIFVRGTNIQTVGTSGGSDSRVLTYWGSIGSGSIAEDLGWIVSPYSAASFTSGSWGFAGFLTVNI